MAAISIDPGQDGLDVQLRELARQVVETVIALDPEHGRELLGEFVSELVLSVAEQSGRADRRQRQAQGIAAAKARGVRFGRSAQPLPDNFDQLHRTWREGGLTLQQAADACGMARSSFYSAAVRREQTPC